MGRVVKVCVFGSRSFNDYDLLKKKLDYYLHNFKKEQIVVIVGCASGADTLGENYAFYEGLSVERYPADWDNLEAVPCNIKTNKKGRKYNSLAGINRNKVMANVCDIAVGFYDGKSPGTKAMIDILKKMNKPTKIVLFTK